MIPQTFHCYFGAYPFLLFSFSVLHFLVVVSVLTYVGFRAHVKLEGKYSLESTDPRESGPPHTVIITKNLSQPLFR